MDNTSHLIESHKSFSESQLWKINADYYIDTGIDAWRESKIPHHLTSNSFVGRTYAILILSYLKDLATQGHTAEPVYIFELGAGHGRLAFHILKHLDRLIDLSGSTLPPYCLVLTDIVEDNLNFFLEHPQLQYYFNNGTLDVSFFDVEKGDSFYLKKKDLKISKGSLDQSTIVIANYLFDSIASDVYQIHNKEIYECEIALHTDQDPSTIEKHKLLTSINLDYRKIKLGSNHYDNPIFNNILDTYKSNLQQSTIFFPLAGLTCMDRISAMTSGDTMLLSLDKGYHSLSDLDKKGEPDLIQHGSFSIWVNFHAFAQYCEEQGGLSLVPSYSDNHLDCVAMIFTDQPDRYPEVNSAYRIHVDDFGPDDFTSLKELTYKTIETLSNLDLITMIRMSHYDSAVFMRCLPLLRRNAKKITMSQRSRLAQTMHRVWELYYALESSKDLPFEIGGFLYDLAYYEESIAYFDHSITMSTPKADVYYNKALAFYQLHRDIDFLKTIDAGKKLFPDYARFEELLKLDLQA